MLLRFPPHRIFSDELGSREGWAVLEFIFKLRKNEEKLNHKLFLSEVFARDGRLAHILCPHWSIITGCVKYLYIEKELIPAVWKVFLILVITSGSIIKNPQCCLDIETQGQETLSILRTWKQV